MLCYMDVSKVFTYPRKEKKLLLQTVIHGMDIAREEKELYIFSMNVLDNGDFDAFFERIIKNTFSENAHDFSFPTI